MPGAVFLSLFRPIAVLLKLKMTPVRSVFVLSLCVTNLSEEPYRSLFVVVIGNQSQPRTKLFFRSELLYPFGLRMCGSFHEGTCPRAAFPRGAIPRWVLPRGTSTRVGLLTWGRSFRTCLSDVVSIAKSDSVSTAQTPTIGTSGCWPHTASKRSVAILGRLRAVRGQGS